MGFEIAILASIGIGCIGAGVWLWIRLEDGKRRALEQRKQKEN